MEPGFIDTVHAVTCILMWLKMLYFLRLFDSTAPLVRVLFSVVWETKAFVGMLFIIYMAFGEAFLRLAEKTPVNDGETVFLKDFADAFIYCVRLSVGDTDVLGLYDINQHITAWILFVIFEVLTCILMFSLLTTIIMSQYANLSRDAELSSYQMRAKLIFENSYLTQIFRCCKCSVNYEKQRNLMIITDITDQGVQKSADEMGVEGMVKGLVEENKELKRMVKRQGREINKKIDAIFKHIAAAPNKQ
jgi:Ion transport protein